MDGKQLLLDEGLEVLEDKEYMELLVIHPNTNQKYENLCY